MKQVNSWTHWQPLKEIVLGNVFDENFFEDVEDPKLRDSLQKIIYETKEDLNGIRKTFEDLGVKVIQPDKKWTHDGSINPYESFGHFLEHAKQDKTLSILKPMITPRDAYCTMGDELFMLWGYGPEMEKNGSHPLDMFECNMTLVNDMRKNIFKKLGPFTTEKFFENELFEDPNAFDMNMKFNRANFQKYVTETYTFDSPCITRLGDTLLVDELHTKGFIEWYDKVKPNNRHKKTKVAIGGHNDGSMFLPKPGVVLSAPWMKKSFYDEVFPNWDKFIISNPNGSFQKEMPKEFQNLAYQRRTMDWYVDGKMDYKPLTNFVDDYLKKWIGCMEETIFEINMVSIDENTVLSLNYSKEIHNQLKSVGIEPIYTKFRHRYFWDGGLNCLTLDTRREGGCESYSL